MSQKKKRWDTLEQNALNNHRKTPSLSSPNEQTKVTDITPTTNRSTKRRTADPDSGEDVIFDELFLSSLADDGLLEERRKNTEFELKREKDLHDIDVHQAKVAELSRQQNMLKLEEDVAYV